MRERKKEKRNTLIHVHKSTYSYLRVKSAKKITGSASKKKKSGLDHEVLTHLPPQKKSKT